MAEQRGVEPPRVIVRAYTLADLNREPWLERVVVFLLVLSFACQALALG